MIHRNLLTQCMFLPVEQVGGAMGEKAELDLDVSNTGTESDTAEDWMMEDAEENVEGTQTERTNRHNERPSAEDRVLEDTEENVERALPETTNRQDEHPSAGNMEMDAGQMSDGGETNGAVIGGNTPQGPSSPRRNPPRNRRPPKKLCCESQVIKSESDQEKIRRGWKVWQRAKARQAAGHV